MKRAWQVKVVGFAAFTMICMESDDDPYETCRAIFGDRLISVT